MSDGALRQATSITFLAVFLGLSACAFLYPIVFDTWVYAHRAPSLMEIYDQQVKRLFSGNPRIGEAVLFGASHSAASRALATISSLALLFLASFYSIRGHLPKIGNATDGLWLLTAFAITAWLAPGSGDMFFYLPFSANYVFGLALLMLFIATFRAVDSSAIAALPGLIVLVPLGFVAGLSNEHTVPGATALVAAYLLVRTVLWKLPISYPLIAGWAALAAGSALLILAPGQSQRYAGSGAGFLDASAMLGRVDSTIGNFVGSPLALALTVVIVCVGGALASRTRSREFWAIAVLIAAAAAFGITSLASPITAPRLLFASHFLLACAAATSLTMPHIANFRPAAFSLAGVAALSFTFLSLASAKELNDQFVFRSKMAEYTAPGCAELVVPQYDMTNVGPMFRQMDDARPDPRHWVNHSIARYYGLPAVTAVPPAEYHPENACSS